MAQTLPAPPSCPGGLIYTVRPGDSMYLIAQRFGISLQCLIEANPQIVNADLIFPGQQICVPGVAKCPTGFFYTVMRGDTLFSIAQRLGVTVNELLRLNPQITDADRIEVGQRICVPLPVPPASCRGEYYIVRSGDTLWRIAQRYNTTVQEILQVNPQITNADLIYAGQVICLPRADRVSPIRPIPLPRPIPSPPVFGPCPPPMRPDPSPLPCPPGRPMPGVPYPSYEGPFFVVPSVDWDTCPYGPRNRFRRPRRRLFR